MFNKFTYKQHPKNKFVIDAYCDGEFVAIYGKVNRFIDADILEDNFGNKPEQDPTDPWIVIFKDGAVSPTFTTGDECHEFIESFAYLHSTMQMLKED